MNSMIGKSTGIALLMAAALLAALFAMGVFSAKGVGAQQVVDYTTLTALTVHPGTDTTNTTILAADVFGAATTEYELTVTVDTSDLTVDPEVETGGTVSSVTAMRGGVIEPVSENLAEDGTGNGTYTVNLFGATGRAVVESIAVNVRNDPALPDGSPADSGVANTYVASVMYTDPSSSNKGGSAASFNVEAGQGTDASDLAAAPGDNITIEFDAAFNVPDVIDPDHISISGVRASTANVSSKPGYRVLTVTWDDFVLAADGVPTALPTADAANHKIRIRQASGITTPTKAGNYAIRINDDPNGAGEADVDAVNVVSIIRSVSVSPSSGASGAEVAVSGKGFTDGSATVFMDEHVHVDDDMNPDTPSNDDSAADGNTPEDGTLDTPVPNGMFDSDDTVLGRATISSGAFSLTTTALLNSGTVNAIDGNGDVAMTGAKFTVTPSITVSPDALSQAEILAITLKDWPTGVDASSVAIGGGSPVSVTKGGSASGDFVSYGPEGLLDVIRVKVPTGTRQGTAVVRVNYLDGGIPASASANVTIDALALSVSPDTAVPGQSVTIQGSGFTGGATVSKITVGGKLADVPANTTANSNGDIVVTIAVPSPSTSAALGSGSKTVRVETDTGTVASPSPDRVGQGTLMVTKAEITLDPAESLRGSSVLVTGTGFPANTLVQLKYGVTAAGTGGNVVVASASDSTGAVSFSFNVPSNAKSGTMTGVRAESVSSTIAEVTAQTSHSTPVAAISVSPAQVSPGEEFTVSGSGFQGVVSVASISVGGVNLLPVPAPITDVNGSFSATMMMRQLDPGNVRVSADVGGDIRTAFVEVVAESTSNDPADVFAGVVATGRLSRVWFLDAENQEWLFYDPDPEVADFNDLNEVTAGKAYIIIVTEGDPVEFQGRSLYQGTNNIPLR